MASQPINHPRRQGARTAPDRSVIGAGLDLKKLAVASLPLIVKMTIKESRVPVALKINHRGLQTRHTGDAAQKAHTRIIGQAGRGALGRHRAGRVDTGEQVIKVEGSSVSSSFIALGVREHTPNLISFFTQQREDGKWVLSLVYAESGTPDFSWTDELRAALLELSDLAWANAHGWDNTEVQKPATLNFSAPLFGQAAKTGIGVVDGILNIIE